MGSDKSNDLNDGIGWLTQNKGFVSLIVGFGSVVVSIGVAAAMMASYATKIEYRIQVNEKRLEKLEQACEIISKQTRAISDEQLRRGAIVTEIRAMFVSIEKRLHQQ